ncbi:MAG: hypothetical protein ACOY0T_36030 [Myxococcota bacterium]
MRFSFRRVVLFACLAPSLVACSSKNEPANEGENRGGTGSSSGGNANAKGGSNNQGGGTSSGGATSNGGSSSGGSTATGGATTGGASSGGSSNGGSTSGGSAAGGSSSGGANNGGSQSTSGGRSNAGGSGGSTNGGSTNGGSNSTGGSTSGGSASGGAGGGGGCSKSADVIFCEDFENVPLGAVSKTSAWSPVTENGSLTVDATHARGQRALHVNANGGGKAYIQVSPFAPPQNSFFGRIHVWVTAFPTAPNYAHYTLVEAAGAQATVIRPIGGQYIEGKGNLWGPGTDKGPTGDWTNWQESAPAQSGKWVCMEWEMAAADNNINIWIDGTAKPDLSVSTKTHPNGGGDFVFPTFNTIWFGWWLYQGGTTPAQFDVWLDDIALGTKRLGC